MKSLIFMSVLLVACNGVGKAATGDYANTIRLYKDNGKKMPYKKYVYDVMEKELYQLSPTQKPIYKGRVKSFNDLIYK